MNNFLASHRVIDVHQQIVADKYWTFCVRYVDKMPSESTANTNGKKEKVDYRKVLDEQTFAKFAAIRAWRKQAATTIMGSALKHSPNIRMRSGCGILSLLRCSVFKTNHDIS